MPFYPVVMEHDGGVHGVCVEIRRFDDWTEDDLIEALVDALNHHAEAQQAKAEAEVAAAKSLPGHDTEANTQGRQPPLVVNIELKMMHCAARGLAVLERVLTQKFPAIVFPTTTTNYGGGDIEIRILKLSFSSSTFDDSGIAQLAQAMLHPLCSVRVLNVDSFTGKLEGVKAVVDMLEHADCRLTVLMMASFEVWASGELLASRLVKSATSKLQKLAIDALPDSALVKLAEAIELPNNQLQDLQLEAPGNSMTAWRRFVSALQHPHCRVTRLDLGETGTTYTRVGDGTRLPPRPSAVSSHRCRLLPLVSALPATNLAELVLDYCQYFCPSTYVHLLGRIPQCTKLRVLSLQDCNVTAHALEEGLRALADTPVSRHVWALARLNLQLTPLRGDASELCRVLAHEKCRIQSIDLTATEVNANVAFLLADCLEQPHTALEEVNLCQLFFTQEGVNRLTLAVTNEHCKLKTVHVDDEDENLDAEELEFDATGLKHTLAVIKQARRSWALVSARQVKRVGVASPLRHLPVEMFRLVHPLLFPVAPAQEDEQ